MQERKKRSIIWKTSRNELEVLVKSSKTFSEILRYVGLFPHGNNQKTLQKRLEKENISFSHIPRGVNANKGRFLGGGFVSFPLEKVLVENSTYNRYDLKKRLFKNGLLENKCYECGLIPEWRGKPLSLQIDHINGICDDNRLENLRILCPNCHSQTDNFAGKKLRVHPIKQPRPYKRKVNVSSKEIAETFGSKKLRKAREINPNWRHEPKYKNRKTIRPSKEELEKLLWQKPTLQLAKEFGVSDKAVEKWAKAYGLIKPGRGYWAKKKFSGVD